LQDEGFTFTDLETFLTKLNPKLYQIAQKSLRENLIEMNFGKRITNELASIACLANYGQSIDIDGFVGLISLAGTITDDLWSVKNGNRQIAEKLLEKSNAKLLLNHTVKQVMKTSQDQQSEKNSIVYQTDNCEEIRSENFDYVLVAFPIYDKILEDNQIDLSDFSENINDLKDLKIQTTNTYFIFGTIKLFPNLPKNKRVNLLSVDPKVPHRSVCCKLPADFSKRNNSEIFLNNEPKMYKIFSEVTLSKQNFDEIFEPGYELVKFIPWLAYPKYPIDSKSKKIPSVILDSESRSRVFYLNALEWSSSCMEISSISAKNVVNLIWNKEQSNQNNACGQTSSKPKIIKRFLHESDYPEHKRYEKILHRVCAVSTLAYIAAFVYMSFK
jgi:prenylcysteine oxidase/farnesylcysteine lyase